MQQEPRAEKNSFKSSLRMKSTHQGLHFVCCLMCGYRSLTELEKKAWEGW